MLAINLMTYIVASFYSIALSFQILVLRLAVLPK